MDESATANGAADTGELPVLDCEVLKGIPGFGHGELLERLCVLFLGEGRRQLEQLEVALAMRDAQAARQAAHRMKSSSGAIGARRVAACAERLEQQARNAALPADEAPLTELRRELQAAGEALAALRAEVAA